MICVLRSGLSVLLAALAMLSMSMPASAVSADGYHRMLIRTRTVLSGAEKAERHHKGTSIAILLPLSREIPDSITVSCRDGKSIETDLSWLSEGLSRCLNPTAKSRISSISSLLAEVKTYIAVDDQRSGMSAESRGKAQRTLTIILAGKEFKVSEQHYFFEKLLSRVLRFLAERSGPIGLPEWFFWILISLIACALLALIIYPLILWYRSWNGDKRQISRKPGHRSPKTVKLTPELLIKEAVLLGAQGRFSEAFRKIYLAMLLSFDKSGQIEYDQSQTNWEYLRRIKKQSTPEQTEIAQSMTNTFDKLIYKKIEASRDDYDEGLELFHKLEATL